MEKFIQTLQLSGSDHLYNSFDIYNEITCISKAGANLYVSEPVISKLLQFNKIDIK